MRDAGHRTPDAGHRTAKKAKIIYPPPRGVDITSTCEDKVRLFYAIKSTVVDTAYHEIIASNEINP